MKTRSKNSIVNYLSMKETDLTLIQAKIPTALFQEIDKIKSELGVSWRDLIVASFNRILDEDCKSKK